MTVGTYVEKVPAPETAQGDIAINFSSHKEPKVRQLIEVTGRPMAPKASFRPSIKGLFREIGQHESGYVAW